MPKPAALVPDLVPAGAPALELVTDTTAENTTPIRYIEGLGYLVGSAPNVKSFLTQAEAVAYVSRHEIDIRVDAFHAYVLSNIPKFFTIQAKKERKKDDGSVTPAEPARVLEGKMLDAALTRKLKAAREVYEFELLSL